MTIGTPGDFRRNLRVQPHVHREREDLWCHRVDLERAMERLPWHLKMVVAMISEGHTDREMAQRLGVKLEVLEGWRREVVALLRADLGEA